VNRRRNRSSKQGASVILRRDLLDEQHDRAPQFRGRDVHEGFRQRQAVGAGEKGVHVDESPVRLGGPIGGGRSGRWYALEEERDGDLQQPRQVLYRDPEGGEEGDAGIRKIGATRRSWNRNGAADKGGDVGGPLDGSQRGVRRSVIVLEGDHQQNSRRRHHPRRNSRADQHTEREHGNGNGCSRRPTECLVFAVIVSGHRKCIPAAPGTSKYDNCGRGVGAHQRAGASSVGNFDC
jgi:hypothetical protein